MTKSCIRCHSKKPLSEYHKDNRRSDLLYPYCKDCRRNYNGQQKREHKKIGELDGYIVVEANRYPCILLPSGRMRVHRYIAEKKLGRSIKKNEHVHHIDGNKQNYSYDNIIVLNASLHRRFEGYKNNGMKERIKCKSCGKVKKYPSSLISKGKISKNLYQCASCYYKSGGPTGRQKQKELLVTFKT